MRRLADAKDDERHDHLAHAEVLAHAQQRQRGPAVGRLCRPPPTPLPCGMGGRSVRMAACFWYLALGGVAGGRGRAKRGNGSAAWALLPSYGGLEEKPLPAGAPPPSPQGPAGEKKGPPHRLR